jgi:hypothetical protein
MGKPTLPAAATIALSMMLAACGGGDDNGGGGGTGKDKPNSAEVQALIKEQGFDLPCEISLKKGPPLEGVVEHVLMECPDPLGSTITVGSYYRYADEAALLENKQKWNGSPHFQNGNVAVVAANVAEGPKRLPALIKKSCGCGEIGGGAPAAS